MNSVFVPAIRSAALALLLTSFCSIRVGFAQEGKSATASVSFSLDFPQSIPDHYEISVASDGQASYDSTGKLTPDSEPGDKSPELQAEGRRLKRHDQGGDAVPEQRVT